MTSERTVRPLDPRSDFYEEAEDGRPDEVDEPVAARERTVRARALADRLADERDKPLSTPPFHASSEEASHAWQAGYQYGLSRAREVIVHQHLDEMLKKDEVWRCTNCGALDTEECGCGEFVRIVPGERA